MSSKETIISSVRIKPVLQEEDIEKMCCVTGNTILFQKTNEKYTFEYIFDENQSTDKIFN